MVTVWKWETSVGKLVIGKAGDKYIVIIGSKKLLLSLDSSTQAGYGIRYWYLCPHCLF